MNISVGQTCGTCRFWSAVTARLCLGKRGPCYGDKMTATDWCPGWKLAKYGAIDSLHFEETGQTKYVSEEGPNAVIAAGFEDKEPTL